MVSQKEVVIIGGGVIGCSIAYHLARQGIPSQIIERDSIAARASGKSWAIFAYPAVFLLFEDQPSNLLFSMPKGSVQPWLELVWMGYHRLPDVALELKEKGGLDIGYSEFQWIDVALSQSAERDGKEGLSRIRSEGYYEGSWLEADDIRAMFPGINSRVRGGLSTPAFQIEPYRYTLALAQGAEKMGASIRQGEAVGFRSRGSRITAVILASGTEVAADVVVLAMGPWSNQGTCWLGKEIPILIHREQCLRVEMPQRLPLCGITTGKASVVPKVDGSVILGFYQIADLQPSFDVSLTTEDVKTALIDGAVDLLPSLKEARLVEHRGDFEGWAPAPNHLQPVLGRLPEWDNAYVAARMGTFGMEMSLGAGQVMAELIAAGGRTPERVKNLMELLSPAGR